MFITVIGDKAYGPFEGAWHGYQAVFKWVAKNGNDPQAMVAFKKARLDEAKRFTLPGGVRVEILPLETSIAGPG